MPLTFSQFVTFQPQTSLYFSWDFVSKLDYIRLDGKQHVNVKRKESDAQFYILLLS